MEKYNGLLQVLNSLAEDSKTEADVFEVGIHLQPIFLLYRKKKAIQ